MNSLCICKLFAIFCKSYGTGCETQSRADQLSWKFKTNFSLISTICMQILVEFAQMLYTIYSCYKWGHPVWIVLSSCWRFERTGELYALQTLQGPPKKPPTTFQSHNSIAHWPIAFKFEHNVLWLHVDCFANFYWICFAQFQMVTTLIKTGQHSANFGSRALSEYVAAFFRAMWLITWISMTPSSAPPQLTCNHAGFTASPCLHKHFPRVSEWTCDVRSLRVPQTLRRV